MSVRDLTILGTSSQQPTRFRNHGAYLIRWNEEGWLFDPGEGTQRQFIFAGIAPPCINRIFISHFHGDHCLGLGSMLMRLNLDKVTHPIHCYYPASGKKYFQRLRYATMYHETIHVVEHPVDDNGIVEETDKFLIEARFLEHGVDNIGWRITEKDRLKFDKVKLEELGITGRNVKTLQSQGFLEHNDRTTRLEDVSWMRRGDIFSYVVDTRLCRNAYDLAQNAKLLICESTYLEDQALLAKKHYHLTARQAATIAKESNVDQLVLTHFSARYLHSEDFAREARDVFPRVIAAQDLQNIPF